MSLVASAFLLTNLACEMLFVIHQRLHAQKIAGDKSQRILRDILHGFLNPSFLKKLFTTKQLCTSIEAKNLFQDLAHMSVMKLNAASMGKLFDLMVMVCKYYTMHCGDASQLLEYTFKHLDELDKITEGAAREKIDGLKAKLRQTCVRLTDSEWSEIWATLWGFFEDKRVKVSVLMQLGVQDPTGDIVVRQNRDCAEQSSGKSAASAPPFNKAVLLVVEVAYQAKFGSQQRAGLCDDTRPVVELGTNLYLRKIREDNAASNSQGATEAASPTFSNEQQKRGERRILSSLLQMDRGMDSEMRIDFDLDGEEDVLDAQPVTTIAARSSLVDKAEIRRLTEGLDVEEGVSPALQSFEDALLDMLNDA